MKQFWSNISIVKIIIGCTIALTQIGCVTENIEGNRYYIDANSRKYMIDTTITSFTMVNNNGKTEKFKLDKYISLEVPKQWYYYFEPFFGGGQLSGKAYAETIGVSFKSELYEYNFGYCITGSIFETKMNVDWRPVVFDREKNNVVESNSLEFNLISKKVTSYFKPKVTLHNQLEVQTVTYKDVIEINYSGMEKHIIPETPRIAYFAGKYGLIKLVKQDGTVLERVKE